MKAISTLIVIFLCSVSFSQNKNIEWSDLLKRNVQKESKKLIEQNLELTNQQAKVFWPIYEEYDAALLEVTNERLKNISDYMLNYKDLDDAKGRKFT